MQQVVILANGLFPTHATPLRIFQEAQRVVCCDGAIQQLLRSGLIRPDMDITVIGDGDSLPAGLEDRVRFIHITEQDTNDLNKATRHCIAQGWTDITYLGATGLREDHAIGNISLLANFSEKYPEARFRMVSDFGTFTPVVDKMEFPSFEAQQVSLFASGRQVSVTSHGLRWDVDERTFEHFWQGTLNAALTERFTIISRGGPTLVYQTHEAK